MENKKESFLIVFEDKTRFNMIIHIKTERVNDSFILYLEPCVRVDDSHKNSRHKIIDCKCNNCSEREKSLIESSKKVGVFNGIGHFSDEEFVSFVSIRLNTLNGIETILEKITGEKHKHINLIDKEKLLDTVALSRCYANSGFECLLKDLGLKF